MKLLDTLIDKIPMSMILRESIVSGKDLLYRKGNPTAAGVLVMCPVTQSIVLGKRSAPDYHAGHWCIFGGGIEPNEAPIQAAMREIYEEAGIGYDMISKPEKIYVDDNGDGVRFQTFIAFCQKELPIKLNSEHDAYGWFKLNDLPSPLHPGLKRLLGDVALF